MESNNEQLDLKSLSLAQYEALNDKEDVDVILEFLTPLKELIRANGEIIKCNEDSMSDFTFKDVIFFKNSLKEQNVNAVLFKMFDVKEEELGDISVYSLTGVYKFITEEMDRILTNEKRLSSKKDSETWREAGIERLEAYGEYANVFMLAGGLIYEDQILSMPYYRVFDYQEISKDWNEIQSKFNKIKNKS